MTTSVGGTTQTIQASDLQTLLGTAMQEGGGTGHVQSDLDRALTSGNPRRLPVAFVTIPLDVSCSMGLRTVRCALKEALPATLRQVKRNAQDLQEFVLVRVTTFSSGVREVVPWSSVDDAMAALERVNPTCGGSTRADLAVADAIERTEEIKRRADDLHLRRGGSAITIVTDGYLTDDKGRGVPYPKELVDRIAALQGGHHIGFTALGMGDAVSEELVALAPPVAGKDGSRGHAVMYQGDYENAEAWRLFARFIANASYGVGTDRAIEDVVTHEGFVIVS